LLLDDLTNILNIDSSNYHSILRNIPNVIEAIWRPEFSSSEKFSPKAIILAGSDKFCSICTIIQSYFKSMGNVPIIIANQVNLIDYTEEFLVIYYDASEEHVTRKSLELVRKYPKSKTIVLSPDPFLSEDQNTEKIDILYVKELKARPYGLEILFTVVILLSNRLGIIPDCSGEISNICLELKNFIKLIDCSNPTVKNPAKRMAGQMVGRLIVIVGSGFLSQVAKFWKDQINSISKSWAQYEFIPEIKINTLKSVHFPESMLSISIFVFLISDLHLPEEVFQISKIKHYLLSSGVGTDEIRARGDSILSQTFNLIVFGEYVAYYLAILNGIDPSFEPILDY